MLIHDKIELLDGDASCLFTMGISQGCATGLLALLIGQVKLGAFIGVSGWMLFRAQFEEIGKKYAEKPEMCAEELDKSFKTTFGLEGPKADVSVQSALSTPILLCHVADDEVVDIELSRQACTALEVLGMEVQSKEYQDGRH